MLEFSVEATYPNDEAIVTAIMMVLSAIMGVLVIEAQQVFAKEYVPWEDIKVRRIFCRSKGNRIQVMKGGNPFQETCTQSPESLIVPRDHSQYAAFLSGFTLCLIFVYIFFFRTSFKRTAANRSNDETIEER